MIHYILEFLANGHQITVHKNDDGTYVVTSDGTEIAACDYFSDAISVYRNNRDRLELAVYDEETGK